jgi:hypothetical protein
MANLRQLMILGGLIFSLAFAATAESPAGALDRHSSVASGQAVTDTCPCPEFNAVIQAVETVFKEYFPKAVIEKTPTSVRISYKCQKYEDVSNRVKLAPQLDGVLLDIHLKPGRYPGKEVLPLRENEVFYCTYFMAPYCKRDDHYFDVRMLFAQNTPEEFIQKFKETVAAHDDSAGSKEEAKQATTPGADAKQEVQEATTSGAKNTANNVVSTDKVASMLSPDKIDFGEARLSTYTFDDARLKIKLPGNPDSGTPLYKGLRFRQYQYDDPDGSYKIAYTILPYYIGLAAQDKFVTDLITAVADATKGKSRDLVSLPYQGYAGRQINVDNLPAGKCALIRVFLLRRYLYVVQLVGTKAWIKAPSGKNVLDSLVIRPEQTEGEIDALKAQERQREAHRQQVEEEIKQAELRNRYEPQYNKDAERSNAERTYGRTSR